METLIAALQMNSSADVNSNIGLAECLLAKAAQAKAAVAVLPENWAFMGRSEQDKLAIAEEYQHGPIQQALTTMAKKYGIWLVAGTIPLRSECDTKVHAASLVYDNRGQCVARYDKIHLFDVHVSEKETYHESATIQKGSTICVVDSPVGKLGLSVCYDLRFPELYRQLVSQGAEILVVPAAFTYVTGQAHWEVLLRARAIENQTYVVAANQVGYHVNERQTYGHSMVISPWGAVLAKAAGDNQTVLARLDLGSLQNLRDTFPCLKHRYL